MTFIADTGWIVAYRNPEDLHHEWAGRASALVNGPVLVCEAVLAEAAFLLGGPWPVLEMVWDETLVVAFELAPQAQALRALARTYADRKPDLADLCVVRMSELYPEARVLTVDRKDFSVYRRFKNQPIDFDAPR